MYSLHMDFPNIMLSLLPMFPTFTIFVSKTMDPIYFETSQSLLLINIVLNGILEVEVYMID